MKRWRGLPKRAMPKARCACARWIHVWDSCSILYSSNDKLSGLFVVPALAARPRPCLRKVRTDISVAGPTPFAKRNATRKAELSDHVPSPRKPAAVATMIIHAVNEQPANTGLARPAQSNFGARAKVGDEFRSYGRPKLALRCSRRIVERCRQPISRYS